MEHHSNIVPWLILTKKTGAVLDYIRVDRSTAKLDESSMEEQLEKSPKLVSVSHCSNVLGTINDIKKVAKKAHEMGATVLVDAAQTVPHMPVDVRDLDADFIAFSGHKMLGPTGIGVLYAKKALLEQTPPVLGGGDMIRSVEFFDFTPNDLPWKFEAGTSNIEGGIALGVAVDYLKKLGMANVREHEKELTKYALEGLDRAGVKIFGPKIDDIESRGGVIAFDVDGIHPHDVATILDSEGIAIRAGHHCAMPLVVNVLGKSAVSRMSFYIYNNQGDVDAAIKALDKVRAIFKRK